MHNVVQRTGDPTASRREHPATVPLDRPLTSLHKDAP